MFSFFNDELSAKQTALKLKQYQTFVSEIPGKGAYVELEG